MADKSHHAGPRSVNTAGVRPPWWGPHPGRCRSSVLGARYAVCGAKRAVRVAAGGVPGYLRSARIVGCWAPVPVSGSSGGR